MEKNQTNDSQTSTVVLTMSFITTKASLFLDSKSRGYYYFGTAPPPGVSQGGGSVPCPCEMKIHDGRSKLRELTLDECGFELVDCPTAVSTEDFYKIQDENDREGVLTKRYFQELESFLMKKLGCDKIVFIHSQVRNQDRAGGNVQGYAVGGPHTDSSVLSGDELALQVLQKQKERDDSFDVHQYQRYLYLNVWRNISEDPIEDYPLAMLDERTTVKPDDYLPRDLFMPGGVHIVQYGLNARHADQHQWYYFPKMSKNEAILFKQVDSDWTQKSRVCFHMAVRDLNAPKDAKPRESIEVRMLCFWKRASVDSMPSEKVSRALATSDSNHGSPATGLHSATFLQLSMALILKLPLIGRLVSWVSSNPLVSIVLQMVAASHREYPPYSGEPNDYVSRVTATLEMWEMWPAFVRKGIERKLSTMTPADGGPYITNLIAQDGAGNNGMKKFTKEQQSAVVAACLEDKAYMKVLNDKFESIFLKEAN